MSTGEQRFRLAKLIEDVVAGRMLPDAALKLTDKWTDMPWREKAIDSAWHALTHFQIDQDICARDSSYEEHFKRSLLKIAASLRSADGPDVKP
jgi:hypothetical protein